MKRRLLVGISAAALIAFVHTPAAFAQHGNSAHTPPPTSHPTSTHGPTTQATHGNSASAHATTHGSSASSHGSAGSSHGSSGTTHGSSKATSSTTTTSSTSSTTTGTTLTPVQEKLQKNTKLASKLQNLLPPGTDLMKAANGFRNLGQFVAAVHVSNNLNISFSKLKADMVDKNMSLGQSIQDLKPSANATKETETAEHEADTDIRTTTTTTTTTSSATLTPVQQKLQKNTKLASKLQNLLPAGTNLMTAAKGFTNFGQFVAAVHVSNNLGIPFSSLKTDMVTKGMSLGQAIQDLKPSANATVAAETAEHEADTDIRTTTTTSTTTTSTTRKHE